MVSRGVNQGDGCARTHIEAAELWAKMLREWQKRFGFEGLAYVDIANEVPYFLPGYKALIKSESGQSWTGEAHEDNGAAFGSKLVNFVAGDINGALSALRREFPELRFTASIHGDERWLDIPVQFDCLDVHFYADIDRALARSDTVRRVDADASAPMQAGTKNSATAVPRRSARWRR